MTNTRRAIIDITYQGANISTDIAPYLSSFSYSDNEGKSDSISITLMDPERKWQGPWLPGKGDTIMAKVIMKNWRNEKDELTLECGNFYVDEVSFKGPPDTITIKALSVPFTNGGKDTVKTRSWENAGSDVIFGDLASDAGLTLMYEADVFVYDRFDQSKETNLACADRLAKKEGLAVKVTNDKLVIYDELTYESKGPVMTIKRESDDVKSYDFKISAAEEEYAEAEINYTDPKTKKLVTYVYKVPDVDSGPILKINKRAKSVDEAMRWAQKEVRAKNKKSKSGSITLLGNEKLVQGITVDVEGWGAYDGKYYVESSEHTVTGGYTVKINIREVLSY